MSIPPVPPAYVGLWKRTLLETPSSRDTTTLVFWLQTQTWHGDIRVPADRPELFRHRSLETLDRGELLALARQQGFAGITEVDGDICRWHRRIDYQAPSAFNDVGRISFIDAMRLVAARLIGLEGVAKLITNPTRIGRCQLRVIRRRPKEYPTLVQSRRATEAENARKQVEFA